MCLLLSLCFLTDKTEEGESETASSTVCASVRVCVRACVCAHADVCSALSVCLMCADAGSDSGKHTHMLKVFVTPLTHCFSVLLLPWKHSSHGNKRCQFFGVGGVFVWWWWGGRWVG